MGKIHKKKVIALSLIVAFFVVLFTTLYFVDPQEIIEKMGIQNAYILTFIISFFGGFSAGGSMTFYATLVTFIEGGLNPYILGLLAGIALSIGDVIMLLMASKGRELIEGKTKERIDRLSKQIRKRSDKSIPFIIYIYMGFSPFPNDILIFSIAAIDYPRRKAYIPMVLADLTFGMLACILISQGILFFF